jgi:hypothetical protein
LGFSVTVAGQKAHFPLLKIEKKMES